MNFCGIGFEPGKPTGVYQSSSSSDTSDSSLSPSKASRRCLAFSKIAAAELLRPPLPASACFASMAFRSKGLIDSLRSLKFCDLMLSMSSERESTGRLSRTSVSSISCSLLLWACSCRAKSPSEKRFGAAGVLVGASGTGFSAVLVGRGGGGGDPGGGVP